MTVAAERPDRRWLVPAAVAAATLPVVVATARALADGWMPIGDNAFFAIRARDVLTDHHPLLGTWTSASLSVGTNLNNPGPLFFDLLAVPARIDPHGGVAVGVAALGVASILGIARFAHRLGGAVTAAAAMAVTAGITWSMGSELLFDPWQPHSMLLPFLLLLVLAWSATAGDPAALPWVAGVASLLIQTHVSYTYLVLALSACALGGVLLAARDRIAGLARPALLTAAVVVVCWAQPVIEQLTGDGEGNLSRLASSAGSDVGATIGPGLAVRVVSAVVALPPWWSRPSFGETFAEDPVAFGESGPTAAIRGVPGAGVAAVAVLALVVVLAAVGWVARRRGDRPLAAGVVVVAVAVLAGTYTAASLPLEPFRIAAHQVRWLWPIGGFLTLVLVTGAAGWPPLRQRGPGVVMALAAVAAALAVANLPRSPAVAGPGLDAAAIPVVRELVGQLGSLEGRGPVLLDVTSLRFAEPYSTAVLAELQRRGIDFDVADEGVIRQLGESRRATDGDRLRLELREGDAALAVPAGAERVALASALDAADRRDLDDLTSAILAEGRARGLGLSALGAAAVDAGRIPAPPAGGRYRDLEPLVTSRHLVEMVRLELTDVAGERRQELERWAELQARHDRLTVGLFAEPLAAAP